MSRRRRTVIALAASLALSATMLTSCSLIHLPGSSSTGGGISIPGVGSVGTGKLPGDFPSAVPVVKGEVISGISAGSGDDKGWNVSIKVSGIDAFDGIATQLTGAGFTETVDSAVKSDKAESAAFTSDSYDVLVAVVKADDTTKFLANYTVATHKK